MLWFHMQRSWQGGRGEAGKREVDGGSPFVVIFTVLLRSDAISFRICLRCTVIPVQVLANDDESPIDLQVGGGESLRENWRRNRPDS